MLFFPGQTEEASTPLQRS